MDLVAVVAAANVTRDAEQHGVLDHEAGLLAELADQRVLGRLAEVDAAAGQPPEGGTWRGFEERTSATRPPSMRTP